MPADLEFEAEWIPFVHGVGAVPKEDPSRPEQLGVGGQPLLLSPNSACLSAWGNGVCWDSLPGSLSGHVAHRLKGSNDGGLEMNAAVSQGGEWLSGTLLRVQRAL